MVSVEEKKWGREDRKWRESNGISHVEGLTEGVIQVSGESFLSSQRSMASMGRSGEGPAPQKSKGKLHEEWAPGRFLFCKGKYKVCPHVFINEN